MSTSHDDARAWVTLEEVAACYECEPEWVREVYEFGLLGCGRRLEGRTVVEARMLERVAVIRRLHVYQGLSLVGVAWLLEPEE